MFTQPPPNAPLPLADAFADTRRPGRVVGSETGDVRRRGIDVENVLAIDEGGLRIRPLTRPGWGRAVLAYGPYRRQPGLAASFVLLNGHHASENVNPWPTLPRFLAQSLLGTQVDPLPHRLARRVHHRTRDPLHRRLLTRRGYARTASDPDAEDNLAFGWLGRERPTSATDAGQGLVVRSAHGENGELRAEIAGRPTPVQERLQNLPLHAVVVLRSRGAVYWAASLDGALGLVAGPRRLRPLAIDTAGEADELWAGVHQRVIGQVGWSIDSRVHGLAVDRPAGWASWWTTALVADRPADGRPVDGAAAEHGGRWRVDGDAALLDPAEPCGLLRAAFGPGDGPAVLVARTAGPDDEVRVSVEDRGVRLVQLSGGRVVVHVEADLEAEVGHGQRPLDVQLVDDGTRLRVLVDGRAALGPVELAPGAAAGTTVGVRGGRPVVEIEAHPRELELPAGLALDPLPVPEGSRPVFDDDFTGHPSSPRSDLAGLVSSGGGVWERSVGGRPFRLDGSGVAVPPVPASSGGKLGKLADVLTKGTAERIAYTVPWPEPALADLTVRILPPGRERHQGEGSRAGLIFWQDEDNLLIVNTWLDDAYDGTSVSSFLRLRGYEEVYDAVWTNVGRRITWGRRFELRTAFDGGTHTTWVDGEPVLHRRLTDVYPGASPLRINRVGLVANWEFGQDTGSRFLQVTGRA